MRSTLRAEIVPTGLPSGAVGLGARTFPTTGGSRTRTHSSRTRLTFAVTALSALFISSCGTAPALRVLASTNAYEYYSARYPEACPGKPLCPEKKAVLTKWSKALDEANAALKRGGAMPLQVRALSDVEKEMPK